MFLCLAKHGLLLWAVLVPPQRGGGLQLDAAVIRWRRSTKSRLCSEGRWENVGLGYGVAPVRVVQRS